MKTPACFLLVVLLFLSEALAGPGAVLKDWPAPGKTPTGLTFDGQLVWVADHGLDQLLAIDRKSGRVVKSHKSPGYRPAGLAFDGQELWCVDTSASAIYRIRPKDGLVTRQIPSPVSVPGALTWDGKNLWVADVAQKTIHQVDPEDGTTMSEIPFPGSSVDGLTWDGKYLWAADRLADKLYALWPEDGQVLVSLPTPGPYAHGLAFDGQNLLVVDYQTDRVYSVLRDSEDFELRQDPREAEVEFINQVRNFGPDVAPKVDLYLAIPRDRSSQKLLGPPVFSPTKFERRKDAWGQEVAHFRFDNLAPGQTAEARMTVRLKAFSVHQVIYPDKVQSLWKIPREIRKRYLGDGSKYDLNHPAIKKALAEAIGREKNPYWIARKIYRYVHDKIHYAMVGGWDIAPKILERGSGSCSEYSFVFIALCRAAGLPARYVGALVVRKDDASYDDVFHRWVEVYLPPYGWVSVDPSRGDKKQEAQRADSFGHVYHDFLVTTEGGGGSEYLRWTYNVDEKHTCKGRCKIEVESMAEWTPLSAAAKSSPKKSGIGDFVPGQLSAPDNSTPKNSCGDP